MVMTDRIPTIVKEWCATIQQRNPKKQLSLYDKHPILMATFENMLVGRDELYQYFIEFLDKQDLRCQIDQNVTIVDHDRDTQVANGLYSFSFIDENGEPQEVKARYTFVICGGRIITQHSSVQPD
tara:strand:+ start:461 stop:835 length:375 start_codon:yes stop_codon:yes gene_type:complete